MTMLLNMKVFQEITAKYTMIKNTGGWLENSISQQCQEPGYILKITSRQRPQLRTQPQSKCTMEWKLRLILTSSSSTLPSHEDNSYFHSKLIFIYSLHYFIYFNERGFGVLGFW